MKRHAKAPVDQKNATQVKSVRFQDLNRFRFYGFTFCIPLGEKLHGVEIRKKDYLVRTDKQTLVMHACLKCRQLLEYTRFYERKSPCKACHIFIVRQWQKKNPDVIREKKKIYNKNYRKRQRIKLQKKA